MNRAIISFFIIGYILFTLQVSFFPGMGLKRIYFWPWTTWHMFQWNVSTAKKISVNGYTLEDQVVKVDLELLLGYIGGGHNPALVIYYKKLFTPLGEQNAFKNRFSEYLVRSYNKKVSSDKEKLKGLDLILWSWTKEPSNSFEDLKEELCHRWSD